MYAAAHLRYRGGPGPDLSLTGTIASRTVNVHTDVAMVDLLLTWTPNNQGGYVMFNRTINATDASILVPDDARFPLTVAARWDTSTTYATHALTPGETDITLTKPTGTGTVSTGASANTPNATVTAAELAARDWPLLSGVAYTFTYERRTIGIDAHTTDAIYDVRPETGWGLANARVFAKPVQLFTVD